MNLAAGGLLAALAMLTGACGSDPPVVAVTSTPDAPRADGATAAVITAKVNQEGAPLDRGYVRFASDMDGTSFSVIEPDYPPDSSSMSTEQPLLAGSATAKLYSVRRGTASVTVTYTDDEYGLSATQTIAITFGGNATSVKSLEYVGSDYPNISIAGTVKSTRVTFKAIDADGQPVADATINFKTNPAGVATINPASARTGQDGTASTTLSSGSVPGSVIVVAESPVDGVAPAQSIPIVISGGVVNARNLSVSCPHASIEGLTWNGLSMDCNVYASDYNGMFVPNTTVILLTEAGGVPNNVLIEQEDGTSGRGIGTFTYDTRCALPRDVPPEAGEFSVACSFANRCTNRSEIRTCNTRDGVSKLVAVTTGAEAFQDYNANLKRDAGEPFTDLGEPYVDVNDNDVHDNGEDFIDANSNNTYDGPNGRWDEVTSIWVSYDILWTGAARLEDGYTSITPVANQAGLPHCSRITYKVTPRDIFGNFPTAAYTTDAFDIQCTGCSVVTVPGIWGNSTGEFSVVVEDGHDCSTSCGGVDNPCPDPINYTVYFGINRSGSAGPDPKYVHEDLGQRLGSFQ